MMKLRRLINAFWAFYKGYPPTVEVDWTPDDARFLNKFLKSQTGQKFKNSLILESYERDRLATLERGNNAPWWAGAATGFRMALLKTDELTVVPTELEDEYEAVRRLSASNRFDQNNR